VAVHLGEADENVINNMAYIWFTLVLEALGKRLNYESISNLLGNAFAKDAGKLVQSANPLVKHGVGSSNIMALGGNIKIIQAKTVDEGVKAAEEKLGDLSWVTGMLGGDPAAMPPI
jgi:hypothetical protein